MNLKYIAYGILLKLILVLSKIVYKSDTIYSQNLDILTQIVRNRAIK